MTVGETQLLPALPPHGVQAVVCCIVPRYRVIERERERQGERDRQIEKERERDRESRRYTAPPHGVQAVVCCTIPKYRGSLRESEREGGLELFLMFILIQRRYKRSNGVLGTENLQCQHILKGRVHQLKQF